MMYYGGGHMSGWGWFGMTIGMIAFWALLIGLAVLVYRALTSGKSSADEGSGQAAANPRQILAERFARGEIDEDEYQRRLAALTGAGRPHHPASS